MHTHRIIKHLSKIHAAEEPLQTDVPPRHVVKHAYITQPDKKWVLKELKTNPAFIKMREEEMNEESKSDRKAESPSKLTKKLKELKAVGEDKNGIFHDVIANEYMNFMSCRTDHARIVVDENQNLVGKLSSFIADLKLLGDSEPDIDKDVMQKKFFNAAKKHIFKSCKQLINEAMSALNDIDVSLIDKELKEVVEFNAVAAEKAAKYENETSMENIVRDKIIDQHRLKLLLNDPKSFAQAVVFIHRLQIEDIVESNIGLDGNNKVVLFDADDSLAGYFLVEKTIVNIHKFPKTKFLEGEDISETIKKILGDKYEVFQKLQYRAWLKELLCPESFIRTLTSIHMIPEMQKEATRVKHSLLDNRLGFERLLLKDECFVAYLRTEAEKDFPEILEEFKLAQQLHKYYADPILLSQVENTFKDIMRTLPKPDVTPDMEESSGLSLEMKR